MILNAFTKTFHKKTILTFPGIELKQDKIYAVIGANGSGKSTLARILSGVLGADNNTAPFQNCCPSIGYLPQHPYVFHMSVKENLIQNGSGIRSADADKASHLMEAFNLTDFTDINAPQLSGGQAARMVLARLLMKNYSLLILDEPAAAMDIFSIRQSETILKKYSHTNHSIVILITHSIKQALRVADEVLFFKDGYMIEHGESRKVLFHPQKPETAEFLDFFDI